MSNSGVGLIGISTPQTARYSLFYASLCGLERPAGTLASFSIGSVISDNRNAITQAALDANADWVLYLDDDHVLPPDTVWRLLSHEVDVVSAHYTQRQPPFNPVLMDAALPDGSYIYKQLSSNERGLVKVAAVGAGCLLVRRPVLEAVKFPWWTLGQISPTSWGDDLYFCTKIREAGFDIYCDLDLTIGHIMQGVVWPQFDEKSGWVANFGQDVTAPPIARWLMPLFGET